MLRVEDSRTKATYTVPIKDSSVPATAFGKIQKDGEGLRVFDSGYQNTAVVRSQICYIDGDRGVLEYRGYPIEELAEKSTFLEVSYLLLYGELPTKEQLEEWSKKVMQHTFVHSRLTELMKTFNYDAHPMGMFISAMAAMSTFHANANPALKGADLFINNPDLMNKQIVRILGKAPTVAAAAYRHRIGRPYNLPQNHLGYTENLLYMMDRLAESDYKPHPVLSKALDVMFILHADHEMNCSTAAMRHIGSSRVDPYSAIAGAAAALYGPLHGGANEAVLHMLQEIGSAKNVPGFLQQVKEKKKKLIGFGHRVYRSYDPRAKIIRKVAYDVFEVCGKEPLIELAVALEQAALKDDYFIKRKLYPNVDFYSGLIYRGIHLVHL
ncbi:Citrate synthase [Paramicrosporidium saccamoebae]|uniref:Citrate synthase n=1 Tax=Paramicrosporidium saccamoebae TaxID=1246581 RepID=A0A2H9TG85_9FUNG|nr:Citrate synthase [Paramicrosporidium saccamoebae]